MITSIRDFFLSGKLVQVFPASYTMDKENKPLFTGFSFKIRISQNYKTQTFFCFRSTDEVLYKRMTDTEDFQRVELYILGVVIKDGFYSCISISPDPLVVYKPFFDTILQHASYYYLHNDLPDNFDILASSISDILNTHFHALDNKTLDNKIRVLDNKI